MWRDDDLAALVPRMVTPRLWTEVFPRGTGLNQQRSYLRSSIARYEILRLHGGLYIDCDLFWLGASLPPAEHAPTHALLSYLYNRAAPVITAPHFMPDAHDFEKNPIPILQPEGTHGVAAGGMTTWCT